MIPVSGGHIEVLTTDMRGDDLLVTVTFLDLLEEILETQTQGRAFRQPDRQTFTDHIAEHKQLQILTDLTVVAFLGLLQQRQVLIQHRAFRERDGVDTRHHRSLLIAAPVSRRTTQHLHRFDVTGAEQVRALTEVRELTLGIGRDLAVLQL